MLMRIWTTRIVPDREDEYVAFAESHSRAMFRSQPGCLGVLFLKSGEEHAACSFWSSQADLDALAHSSSYRDTVAALRATGLLAGDTTVKVYEVEGGSLSSAINPDRCRR
jgi:heme-degrading monooxygenase HmoA